MTETLSILRKLAEVDPIIAYYTGDVYCLFCGRDDCENHKIDCTWFQAKKLIEKVDKACVERPLD